MMNDTNTRITYKLQSGRYGEDWEIVDDYPRDASDLQAWIVIAGRQETHGGKYEYRVVDSNDNPVWHQKSAYEGVRVNIYDPDPANWLNDIRADYGIESALFANACREWLEKYGSAK